MARPCALCGANLNIVGDRHRCVGGRPGGQKPLTRLEQDKIARGELDPASLISQPATKPQEPLRRLAPRHPPKASAPAEQPKPDQTAAPPVSSRQSQPTLADILAGIDRPSAQFEALRSALVDKPRTDA